MSRPSLYRHEHGACHICISHICLYKRISHGAYHICTLFIYICISHGACHICIMFIYMYNVYPIYICVYSIYVYLCLQRRCWLSSRLQKITLASGETGALRHDWGSIEGPLKPRDTIVLRCMGGLTPSIGHP